ncbi:hypothetical protein ANCCAN_18014 [Ancylostoma caninum]|uniref:Uncharacterized protein n=1 Tax=Ancylostoma caninum TaxID=29170 RepID=A0A368FX99_ANCCA|nr:hypothetical protein ANCCAN_18014 [Ancylostoma caninum]
MKPKRRSTFSPASVETTLKSPRPKRKRLDSSSPLRRKSSNSSDEIKPPPEFIPFPYEKLCPKFRDLLGKTADDFTLEKDDLKCSKMHPHCEAALSSSTTFVTTVFCGVSLF